MLHEGGWRGPHLIAIHSIGRGASTQKGRMARESGLPDCPNLSNERRA
jgi:hypothetical protein